MKKQKTQYDHYQNSGQRLSQHTLSWIKSTIETLKKVRNMSKVNNKDISNGSYTQCRFDAYEKLTILYKSLIPSFFHALYGQYY